MSITCDPSAFCIWEHSQIVADLYRRRCRLEEPEMDCAAQATSILCPYLQAGQRVLDAGCGSGYFFHSLQKLGVSVEYHGLDASSRLISIGRDELPLFGCHASNLHQGRIEECRFEVDHCVCMNVLSNIDHFYRPLESLFRGTRQTVLLRESLWNQPSSFLYVRDRFLDAGINLRVHVNTYNIREVCDFAEEFGFSAEIVTDMRTQGKPENVIGFDHYWTFILFRRTIRT